MHEPSPYKFIVSFRLKPESLPPILEAARHCIAATREEPGCLSYEFFTSVDRADALIAVECFRSRGAHAEHLATDHFKAFAAVLVPNVVASKLEAIVPHDAASVES